MPVRKEHVLAWLDALRQAYSENRQRLTDLDSAIGDADHGINMDRGFTAAQEAVAAASPADIRAVLQTVAASLIRHVGGAAGPLYGTFFLRAGTACAGKPELDAAGLVALFEAGVKGVQQLGKAEAGDKTMLDALMPAVAVMRKGLEDGGDVASLLDAAAAAAEAGMHATIPMQARKGRASYLGPRSAGHQDPGATSAYLLLRAAATSLRP